ncbi:MAG TPA: acylneuraminate cytidylyltransferase family protein, partial [Segetibacter sp.]
MKNLCIIPARSGSKGVPGKNTKPLNGRPLIQYTFDAAIESRLLDLTILSTDSVMIAEAVTSPSITVPFIRPMNLALDNTPTVDVIKHALTHFDNKGEYFDNIILLQATCPFRSEGFVDKCIETFVESGADCLVSVKKVPHEFNPHWVFITDEQGLLKVATGDKKIIPSRQLLPEAFARDGSVYVFKADNIRNKNSIYGESISYLQSESLWHVNI